MSRVESQPPRAPSNKPAGLNNILNNDDQPLGPSASPQALPPVQLRDSGFYSTADVSSKHTSAASLNVTGLSPTNSGYQSSSADKTPSPTANNVPLNVVSPLASNMSVASIVSPTTPGSERRYERPTSYESSTQSGATLGENSGFTAASRRESVDSRINLGLGDLRLGGSPYASNNQSTTSIQNTLHSQRNPRPGYDALSAHRISNGYQPSAERNPEPKTVRTAPAITGPATSHIARAAEPTKGQAWAFPEEEIHRVGPPSHYDDSRRSSIAESVSSSQFTAESRLPAGQRRLDDGPDYTSGDFLPVHHHTMQQKTLSDLQADAASVSGSQPYSRTPELRVSHKLAERKRRTEMKDLFDQLRDLMPQERGTKASKWEILTKAIAEHQRLNDHMRALQAHCNTVAAENEMLRREVQGYRMDNAPMRGEVGPSSAQPQPPPTQQPPSHAPPPAAQPSHYASDPYANPNRTELPPLRSISSGIPNGPDSMTGVQYEAPRASGYRPERY